MRKFIGYKYLYMLKEGIKEVIKPFEWRTTTIRWAIYTTRCHWRRVETNTSRQRPPAKATDPSPLCVCQARVWPRATGSTWRLRPRWVVRQRRNLLFVLCYRSRARPTWTWVSSRCSRGWDGSAPNPLSILICTSLKKFILLKLISTFIEVIPLFHFIKSLKFVIAWD